MKDGAYGNHHYNYMHSSSSIYIYPLNACTAGSPFTKSRCVARLYTRAMHVMHIQRASDPNQPLRWVGAMSPGRELSRHESYRVRKWTIFYGPHSCRPWWHAICKPLYLYELARMYKCHINFIRGLTWFCCGDHKDKYCEYIGMYLRVDAVVWTPK